MTVVLNEASMQPTETLQIAYTVVAPQRCDPDDTLHKSFWRHVSRKLRPLGRINVIAEDGSWYQELLCLAVDGADIRMAELGRWENLQDTSDLGEEKKEGFRVEWGGPVHLFRLVRNEDDHVIQTKLRTREDAERARVDMMKVPVL